MTNDDRQEREARLDKEARAHVDAWQAARGDEGTMVSVPWERAYEDVRSLIERAEKAEGLVVVFAEAVERFELRGVIGASMSDAVRAYVAELREKSA